MEIAFIDHGKEMDFVNTYSPFEEMAAYEAIWSKDRSINYQKLAAMLINKNVLPSELISEEFVLEAKDRLKKRFYKESNFNFDFILSKSFDYPQKLKDAKEPIEVLYYQGCIDLINSRSIAIVGSRKPSEEGLRRASKLARLLIKNGFTIISGLAEGIDTVAHQTAIENNGNTIAVIGTPLDEYYPKKNEELQKYIAKNFLLVSQVPFLRYSEQTYRGNRLFFPERNKTMSAISEATIIVEASDTSGTLIQAKAALEQGRKLFILQSCFENTTISWPGKFEKLGAIRVNDFGDIMQNLSAHE